MAVRRRKITDEEANLRRKLIDLWVAGCRGSEGYAVMDKNCSTRGSFLSHLFIFQELTKINDFEKIAGVFQFFTHPINVNEG